MRPQRCRGLIPDLDRADVSRASWLTPRYIDETGRLKGSVQAFVVLIAGKVIIVDPGVGNEKNRTAVPGWNDLHTDFLDRPREHWRATERRRLCSEHSSAL